MQLDTVVYIAPYFRHYIDGRNALKPSAGFANRFENGLLIEGLCLASRQLYTEIERRWL
jgi:hypothetical protein